VDLARFLGEAPLITFGIPYSGRAWHIRAVFPAPFLTGAGNGCDHAGIAWDQGPKATSSAVARSGFCHSWIDHRTGRSRRMCFGAMQTWPVTLVALAGQPYERSFFMSSLAIFFVRFCQWIRRQRSVSSSPGHLSYVLRNLSEGAKARSQGTSQHCSINPGSCADLVVPGRGVTLLVGQGATTGAGGSG